MNKALEYCETNYVACVEIARTYNEMSKYDIDFFNKEKKDECRQNARNYLGKFDSITKIMHTTNSFVDFGKKYNLCKSTEIIESCQRCVEINENIVSNMKDHERFENAGYFLHDRCYIL